MSYDFKTFDINNYIIHKKAIYKLTNWLNNFNQPGIPSCAVIYGYPGGGKTTLVHSLYKYFNYDIILFEPNAANTHKKEIFRLEHILNENNIMMMINNIKKGILFDDIEIGTSGDRGFVSDIISLIDKKKKKKFLHPLIITLNKNINNKKTQLINKNSLVIELDRIHPNDLFKIGKKILLEEIKFKLDDTELRLITETCQGDIRNLVQKLNPIFIKDKKWEIISPKDIQIRALPVIEKYINTTNKISYEKYGNLFLSDTIFVPGFIYENYFSILDNRDISSKKKKKISYKILYMLSNWCLINNLYKDSSRQFIDKICLFNGFISPMYYLKLYPLKKKTQLRTTNLYSRISQASFNSKSICEISSQLSIHTSEFHLCSFLIYLLIKNNINFKKILVFLKEKKINITELDRILRYNCLSDTFNTKLSTIQRSLIKKNLN